MHVQRVPAEPDHTRLSDRGPDTLDVNPEPWSSARVSFTSACQAREVKPGGTAHRHGRWVHRAIHLG